MSNKHLSGKALVIQIERESVRIAQMALGTAMPQISRAMVLPTPENAVEDGVICLQEPLRELLKSALSAPEWKRTRRVVFSLCTTQVISEVVSVPAVNRAKLKKLLRFNLDVYFPIDVRDYHVVWEVIGASVNEAGAPELTVQLWAAPNALLMQYYALANACGLSVAAIDWCGRSMASAVNASFTALTTRKQRGGGRKKKQRSGQTGAERQEGPGGTTLYLLTEAEHLLMTFVRDGQVKLQRLLHRGSGYAGEVGEAQMVLEYYNTMETGDRVIQAVVCGSKCGEPGYADQIGSALNLPVRPWDAEPGTQWCLCAGASRARLDFGDPAMNRPGRVGKRLGQVWQYGLILAAGVLLAGSLTLTFGSKAVWASSLDSLKSTQRMLQLQSARNIGNAQLYYEYSDLYDQYSADWDVLFGSLRTYNDNLVLLLNELESVLPSGASVVSIGIAEEGMGLQFSCSGKEEAAYLIVALRKLQFAALDAVSPLTKDSAQAPSGQDMLSSLSAVEAGEAPPEQGGSDGADWDLILQQAAANSAYSDYTELLENAVGSGVILSEDISGAVETGQERIYFSAALGYQPALLQAELERRGLSCQDKLNKLEVLG